MIKKFFTFLFPVFIIAVAFTASCSLPIGSLLADSGNYIKAVPNQMLYHLYDEFIPENEVTVVGFFNGERKTIEIKDVKIKIINVWTGDEILDYEQGLPFESIGMNTVVISYLDMETDYPIQVVDPDTDIGGGGGGGGPSITIIWDWE